MKSSKPARNASASVAGGPYQYIKGWVEFYKLSFKVTPDVLIPRPESELLVDEILNFYTLYPTPLGEAASSAYTLVDIGTGCGNIAISLACNLRGCNVNIIATDISSTALNIAKINAKLHGVEKKIKFIQSDLLENPSIHHTLYTILIIVANLPYIPTARIPYLDSSVKDFEPHIALNGGEDGFELYRKLFKQLKKRNWLARRSLGEGRKLKIFVGEIDYTHGELALQEAQKYFPDAQIEIKTDLSQKQRILKINLP